MNMQKRRERAEQNMSEIGYIKFSNQQAKPNTNSNSDSFTEVHVRPSGVRKPVGIRVDTGLWEAFKRVLRAQGLSTCEVIEKFIVGYMGALSVKVHSSQTIYVVVDYPKVVKRVRRRQLVFEDEVDVYESVVGRDGIFCVLKQESLPILKLPCLYWKKCKCGNFECWSRVQRLLRGLEKEAGSIG